MRPAYEPTAARALIVDDELTLPTATGRATRTLIEHLEGHLVHVIQALSPDDGASVVLSDPGIQCYILDWGPDDPQTAANPHSETIDLIRLVRERNTKVPIFLTTERHHATHLTAEVMRQVNELIWILEDTPPFIAGRILAATQRYLAEIVPPMTKALMQFAEVSEYSWHTPGHAGGIAFLKSPVGRIFYDYFGEHLFRSDLSNSVLELGSLLDHTGPIGDSERYAARVFGADRSYTVTNGSSTSNRVVIMASVTQGDIALVDRNCHKSIEQALTMSGAIPVYLQPSRNALGLIGPVLPSLLEPEAVQRSIASSPLVAAGTSILPRHAVITNSTYDGLCYHAGKVTEALRQQVDCLHFDEAWYGYAPFHPLYRERFGLHRDGADVSADRPTIFTVTSTHKLLAGLSQASFIHVREGRRRFDHVRFNEAFMMHASTSPQYAIIASNEVSASMMDGASGLVLTSEAITEAVAFRRTVWSIFRDLHKRDEWFFTTWNADEITDPATGHRLRFEDAPEELLAAEPDCWVLHADDNWHGFSGVPDGYCMLDPVKVSVVTPGVQLDGSLAEWGIPAALVSRYLDQRGTVAEKTSDFTILFLFSFGITKGKWGTLLNGLLNFKSDYDANAPLLNVLPDLVATYPSRYQGMGLRDLSTEMFDQMRDADQLTLQEAAFTTLPLPELAPSVTYQRLVHDQVEPLPLSALANRVVAVGVVPYPPGIPLLMPGENGGPENSPYLGYLQALQAWDRRFPGFEHEVHGVATVDGTYTIYCLKHS